MRNALESIDAGGFLDDLAADLAGRRAAAEVDILAAVMADPVALAPVAEAEGVTVAAFAHEDLAALWIALLAGEEPERALRRVGHWDPRGPIGTGSRWSRESLDLLANSWPRSVVATRANARRLLALGRQWATAEVLLRRLRRALSADVSRPRSRSPIPERIHVRRIGGGRRLRNVG